AQQPLDMREVALCAFLAVRDEADGLALERRRARRRDDARGLHLVGRIEHADHGLRFHPFAGSQSTHAPIAAVTALVLCPIQGGMIAPNPPAGPPAATTSSASGESSAV